MSGHTPEPWYWDDFDAAMLGEEYEEGCGFPKYADCYLSGSDGRAIIPIRIDHGDPIWDISRDSIFPTKFDRGRIVACVNALAGIPDPAAFVKAARELADAEEQQDGLYSRGRSDWDDGEEDRVVRRVERALEAFRASDRPGT